MSLPAQAGDTGVAAIWPATPLRAGANTADLAFDVTGASDQIVIDAIGSSISAGSFASVHNLIVGRDRSGAIAFRAQLPLAIPYPADGVLTVTASAIAQDGTHSPALTVRFDSSAGTPGFAGPVEVKADTANGSLLLRVPTNGPVAQGTAAVSLFSAQALRTVGGNLQRAHASAIIDAPSLSARPEVNTPGLITFSVPVDLTTLPGDGVVVADVQLTDPFGRSVHTSTVEFTSAAEFDTLLGISVSPTSIALTQGYGQRVPLTVTARFAISGAVQLTRTGQGVGYSSRNPDVAGTSPAGDVIARQNGSTDVDVTFGGFTASVPVVVDSDATLDHLELAPAAPSIDHVGGHVQLSLTGVLSTGLRPDLTPSGAGTVWSSADTTLFTVSPDGLVTSRRPGSGLITATNGQQAISVRVEALDAPPTVTLLAPGSVAAGTSFIVSTDAQDDVGIDHVQFLVNGVPALTAQKPPFTLRLQAPPYGGQTLKLAATATDTGGHSVRSADVFVNVTGAQAGSATPVVYDNPQPGALLIEGIPVVLRVTSGDWTTGELSAADFQQVNFSVNGVAVGTANNPRMEARQHQTTDENGQPKMETLYVPLWETTWTPPAGSGGTSAVLRGDGLDRFSAMAHGDALLVRIASPTAPLVTIKSPVGAQADATESVPLVVSGTVGDVTLALGATVTLLVDGNAVASQQVRQSEGGSLAGSSPFSLSWTPPHERVGKLVHVEVSATDTSNLTTRIGFQALVRPLAPPLVSVLSPADQASVIAGQQITLTASVLGVRPDGFLVTWVADGVPVGISTAAPYALAYTVPASAAGRTVQLEADAQDANGQHGYSTVTIAAIADKNPPSLSMVTPRDGADVADSQDLLVTVAGLDDVDVASVDILLDGAVVPEVAKPNRNGNVAGSFIAHSLVRAASLAGSPTHRIGARATDPSGNVGYAPEITIHTHPDAPPQVSFTRPEDGSTVTEHTTLEVVVNAVDDVAVKQVALSVNGAPLATATRAPYVFLVPAGSAGANGATLTLHAVATDSSNLTSSADLNLSVQKDKKPPLVGFRAPLADAHVFAGRTLAVQVLASDDVA
ncbi:MAG: hypothetical protein JST92_18415, partial [Deltaproteobacteria bacterium]|nr:hypothetical protein [Deltaproteobacteria bacterium]